MSNNPFVDYQDNYRQNLPTGVVYAPTTANYFYLGQRFPTIYLTEFYRTYVERFVPPASWFLSTGTWRSTGIWTDSIDWN